MYRRAARPVVGRQGREREAAGSPQSNANSRGLSIWCSPVAVWIIAIPKFACNQSRSSTEISQEHNAARAVSRSLTPASSRSPALAHSNSSTALDHPSPRASRQSCTLLTSPHPSQNPTSRASTSFLRHNSKMGALCGREDHFDALNGKGQTLGSSSGAPAACSAPPPAKNAATPLPLSNAPRPADDAERREAMLKAAEARSKSVRFPTLAFGLQPLSSS